MLQNQPPKQTSASINKQDVPKVVATVAPTEQPPKEAQKVEKPVEAPQIPVGQPVGCEAYRELVSRYSWNIEVATNVMRAESKGCDPSAVGDNYPINGLHAVSCGLFQIRTLSGRPSCEELKNPEVNVAWAYRLYTANGWQPWSVCRGIVHCY